MTARIISELNSDFRTLPDLLFTTHATDQEIAFHGGKSGVDMRTVADVREAALARLGTLQRAGMQPGDELVMPLEDLAEFVETFWACLLGGVVAMPLSPAANDSSCAKILDIVRRRAGARVAIDDAGLARLEAFDAEGAKLVADRRVDNAPSDAGERAEREPGDIAFVQYSSGSTRAPKGVIVRHRQALANLAAFSSGARTGPDDRTFSWMPLSHDMGLVGFHLGPLFSASHQVLMPTSAFARAPLMWLEEVTRTGATILSSPNFGYRHVLKAADRKGIPDGVDLSKVRLVLNGAEPISVELAEEFMARLAPHGLRDDAMFPVYGLAEATLAVTFPRLGDRIHGKRLSRERLGIGDAVREPDGDDALVACACGSPLEGIELRLVDLAGNEVAEGTVGSIWMRGDSITEGYHDDPEATAEAVRDGGWLDTGDLGFMSGGELYVTGRRKDLVIVDGQNYYPHDLEESLGAALDIDPIRLAAAPVRRAGGAESLAVFVQHRGDADSFVDRAGEVRAHLSKTFGVSVESVVPVERIPRTTSGKVQRAALAAALLRGELEAVAAPVDVPIGGEAQSSSPATGDDSPEAMEAMLMGFCDEVLGGLRFGPTDDLFEQGMSSIDLAEIHGLIEARYPKSLDIRDFFDSPSVRQLAAILSERVRAGTTAPA